MNLIHKIQIALLIALLSAQSSYAVDTASDRDVDRLFDWAEITYSAQFAPSSRTQSLGEWRFRFYSETNTYVGVNSVNDVYVLGDRFGGLVHIAPLSELLTQVSKALDNKFFGTWEGTLSGNKFRFVIKSNNDIYAINLSARCEVLFTATNNSSENKLSLNGDLISGPCVPDPVAQLTSISANELLFELSFSYLPGTILTGRLFKVINQ